MTTSTPTLSLQKKIENFLFAEEVPYGLALLRITMPLIMLQGWMARWPYCEEIFSSNGVNVSLAENFFHTNYLQPLPPFWAACLMSVLILTLVTSALGWFTRFSLVTSLLLHVYFACNDMASTTTKFTVVSTHVMLLLSLSGCGKIWSIDSWLAGRRDPGRAPLSERPTWATAPRWPQVLLVLMIGASYLGAAITKLHMPDFVTGDAIVSWIMSNPNYRHPFAEHLSQYPGLLTISAQATVLWEILFLFMCWRGVPRQIMFGLGIFFHTMAVFTLGEATFLMVMSSCYLGCLQENEALAIGSYCQRIRSWIFPLHPRDESLVPSVAAASRAVLRLTSPRFQLGTLTALLLVAGLGGGWMNQRLDLYGTHRPEGPYELTAMSTDEAARLFAPAPAIRESDKYLGVKLGTLRINGRLANHCDSFHYKDLLICEAGLNPPHEDMWIEFHVMTADRQAIHRDGIVAPRESRFAQFSYTLTDTLEPGEYILVVRSRNQEICHRSFTLEMDGKAPVAN